MQFITDLLESGGKGVRDLVNGWIGSFLNVATLFKRLDNEGTYLREMHADQNVCMLLAVIYETLAENESKCMAVKDMFDKHSYLWTTNLPEFFAAFCEDAKYTTPNGQVMLDLQKFEEAILKYEGIRETVMQLQSPMDVGWLRINTQPVKSQLITWTGTHCSLLLCTLRHSTVCNCVASNSL